MRRLPDDLSFAERIAGLYADASERVSGPVEGVFAILLCNGCGREVQIDVRAPCQPDGWIETAHGDLCAICAESRGAESERARGDPHPTPRGPA